MDIIFLLAKHMKWSYNKTTVVLSTFYYESWTHILSKYNNIEFMIVLTVTPDLEQITKVLVDFCLPRSPTRPQTTEAELPNFQYEIHRMSNNEILRTTKVKFIYVTYI